MYLNNAKGLLFILRCSGMNESMKFSRAYWNLQFELSLFVE